MSRGHQALVLVRELLALFEAEGVMVHAYVDIRRPDLRALVDRARRIDADAAGALASGFVDPAGEWCALCNARHGPQNPALGDEPEAHGARRSS